MVNHVKPSPVEYVIQSSYSLEVRAVDGGWEISCPPGPLADFLLSAASPATIRQRGLYIIVELSSELDREIMAMIQALIDLRYRTGRVQLELWANL